MKFIPYVCCGDPNLDFTYKLVKTLAPYSYLIELGFLFRSDCRWKTIQGASERALKSGANTDKIFSMVETLRKEHIKTPFVFMTYYNIVYAYGRENFLQRMAKVGVQGIIIPDLPFEEDKTFENLTEKYNISIVNLISSNTQIDRSRKILQKKSCLHTWFQLPELQEQELVRVLKV